MSDLDIMWRTFENALAVGDLEAAADILRVIAPHDPEGAEAVLLALKVAKR